MTQAILKFGQTTFSSLRVRNYRLYFIGQAISLCGTWMQTVAVGWLTLQLTNSGTQLGLITAAQFVPLLIFGPWGGLIVDRVEKKGLLIWTQTAFGVLAGLLSALIFAHMLELWMLYVFALGLGVVRIFDNPARQTFVSEMVGEDQVKNAVSLNSTANNLARAVGPSIGGILIAAINIGFCFLFNALSYIAVIVMLVMMNEKELNRGKLAKKKPGQIKAGFTYVKNTPLIRNVLVMMAIVGTFAYEFNVSLPLMAENFASGAAGYAALMSAFGAGAVVGGLFAAGRHNIRMRTLAIFTGLFGLAIIATALAPTLQLAILGIFLTGVFSINLTALANTMIQLEAEPQMRGRVMSLWSLAMIGSTPIGGPIVGWIGEHAGPRMGLGIGGVATLLALILLVFMHRQFSGVPDDVQIEVDEESLENVKVQ